MKRSAISLALVLALILALAGCNTNSSSSEASSEPGAEREPVFTYVDPNPDMVLATMPDGKDVTYEGYRLYLDVTQGLDGAFARQDMALVAALEKDLAAAGVALDEAAYQAGAAERVADYSSSKAMQTLIELSGLDAARVAEAMKLTYRPEFLIDQLFLHYQTEADKTVAPVDPDKAVADAEEMARMMAEQAAAIASSDASSAAPVEPQPVSREQAIAQAEMMRGMEVQAAADAKLNEYYDGFLARCDFSNKDILAVLDGEEVPLTQAHSDFIAYIGTADRLNLLTLIQTGEIMLRELEQKQVDLSETELAFETQFDAYIQSMVASAEYMAEVDRQLALQNATRDDFYASLRRPLWLQTIGYDFAQAVVAEYAELPEDANRPASEEEYYMQRVEALAEGSSLVNPAG